MVASDSAPARDAHIVTSFDGDLSALADTIDTMGRLAVAQTRDAVRVVIDRETTIGAQVLVREADMNALEARVNDQVVRLLALRQPVADDLRTAVAALKVATMLERVGDYAASAARRGPELAQATAVPIRTPVARMGDLVTAMLDDALVAYARCDVALARAIRQRDADVDALHSGLFRELLTYMMEDPRTITACSHLMFIAKTLERVGDQATNIAEVAQYRATGMMPRDERVKDDTACWALAPLPS